MKTSERILPYLRLMVEKSASSYTFYQPRLWGCRTRDSLITTIRRTAKENNLPISVFKHKLGGVVITKRKEKS